MNARAGSKGAVVGNAPPESNRTVSRVVPCTAGIDRYQAGKGLCACSRRYGQIAARSPADSGRARHSQSKTGSSEGGAVSNAQIAANGLIQLPET